MSEFKATICVSIGKLLYVIPVFIKRKKERKKERERVRGISKIEVNCGISKK